MAGFGGGKERGIRMIEDAAAYGGDNQDDARFALILIYNRERQYDEALKQLSAARAVPAEPAGLAGERRDQRCAPGAPPMRNAS